MVRNVERRLAALVGCAALLLAACDPAAAPWRPSSRPIGSLPSFDIAAVGPGTAYPLTSSWRPGCPVGPADLRAVEFDHFRPDGTEAAGVLIVHRDVADDVRWVVQQFYVHRFPLTQARPIDDFGGSDDVSMAADNSSAFNCRTVAGTNVWSEHAYGRAIDLNPMRNPYVSGSFVDPPGGGAWLDRADIRPGMIVAGSPTVALFADIGWGWGGDWRSVKDHQHFSANGR